MQTDMDTSSSIFLPYFHPIIVGDFWKQLDETMGQWIVEIKTRLVAFLLFWNSCSFHGVVSQKTQLNLPGEPLTPQDFQNARTLPEKELSDEHPECETFRNKNENKGIQRSFDQPDFNVWDHGFIPYLVDIQFDLTERATIARAIATLKRTTCIKFINKLFQSDYVFIAKRRGPCGSYVGRKGGEQLVTLSQDCMTEGTIVHEFLHVIGFEHEQCRMDRDQYIRISFYNISESGKHNFFKIPPPRANYAGPYDVTSITHYSAFAFGAKEGLQTIFPKDNVKGAKKMGQRKRMSEMDKFKVNNYYNCSEQVPLEGPLNMSSLDPNSDFHDDCSAFALIGACHTSNWMKVNCRKTCKISSEDRPTCSDYNDKCFQWAEEGECLDLVNGDYMRIYCSKSCNFCHSIYDHFKGTKTFQ